MSRYDLGTVTIALDFGETRRMRVPNDSPVDANRPSPESVTRDDLLFHGLPIYSL